MMDEKNAIEIRNVSKSFKIDVVDPTGKKGILGKPVVKTVQNTVFEDLNLDVKKGEILGIIGHNGAGKSTLLSIAARILEPDSGTVETAGKVVSILQLSIGFNPDLSGRENIYNKAEMYEMTRSQVDEIIEDIIDYSGVRKYIDNPLRSYSSGMTSRLAFAIMVHLNVNILVADEVLSTGDAGFSAKATESFKKFLKDGKTVLFVSHNIDYLEQMCTRVIWIDGGKIRLNGNPEVVCSKYKTETQESFEIVYDYAKNGFSDAQYKLAIMYRDGVKVEQNLELYREWIKTAAENGNIFAQAAYADILMESDDEADKDLAVTYYRAAAERGNGEARMKLAAIVGEGSSLAEDRAEILDICRQLAELGNPVDMNRYASILMTLAKNDNDKAESFKWYLKVAEYGSPDAMLQVATMYQSGVGTPKDNKKYVEWILKAADFGHPKALTTAGDMYLAGKLVPQDKAKALEIYTRLAMQGSAGMQYKISTMYRDGVGTEKNEKLANFWLNTYGKCRIASYQLQVRPLLKLCDIKTKANAKTLTEKAYATYNQSALATVTSWELEGKFAPKNIEKARELYIRAADVIGKPEIALEDMYFTGKVFDKNLPEALRILRKYKYLGDHTNYFRMYRILSNPDNGAETDMEEAMEYLRLAVLRGDKYAIAEKEKLDKAKAEASEKKDVTNGADGPAQPSAPAPAKPASENKPETPQNTEAKQ
ncbi:MAG: ATP-binding cassette domain-containing protein [archaeon]|nr:ATP-binding cassette domain-containing protein [archaeon]